MTELLDYHEALRLLLNALTPLDRAERVPLHACNGRTLAEDMAATLNVPAFDNSAMDGYAVAGLECDRWRLVGRLAAGDDASGIRLQAGEAVRIFTGAPIPQGAQAVLMQEDVSHADGFIQAQGGQAPEAGAHIRRCAEELQSGARLLDRGQPLSPAAVGLLAGQGYGSATCTAKLRVTVFSSGDELIEPGAPVHALRPGQVYDSNRHMLLSWLHALPFEAIDGGRLPDQEEASRLALQQAAQHSDVILCSGGASVGEADHLKAALTSAGSLAHWRLAIKPGKPFAWGHMGPCSVFLLPGNPVASLVTFQQLVLPGLRRLSGLSLQASLPVAQQARASFRLSSSHSRREFLRVQLDLSASPHVQLLPHQGSAMLSGASQANALAEVPPHTPVAPGDVLTVYPLYV